MPERFNEIVRRIMADPGTPEAQRGDRPPHPESFGWLRRPDLDEADGEAWELPDGAVRITAFTEGKRDRPGGGRTLKEP